MSPQCSPIPPRVFMTKKQKKTYLKKFTQLEIIPNSCRIQPQDRKIEGYIVYTKEGKQYKYSKVWSIPCSRCEGCPVYKIDTRITPTAYYCQCLFAIGAFNCGINEGTIPDSCQINSVVRARENHNR